MKKVAIGITIALAGLMIWVIPATAVPEPKVGICHRTASDSNPYVYQEVNESSVSAHLDNTHPGHNPTYWGSDGTWRGVPHEEGDPKNDYLAPNGPSDCDDITPSPSPSPSESPSPSPSESPSPSPSEGIGPGSITPPPPKSPKPPKPLAFTGIDFKSVGLMIIALGLGIMGWGLVGIGRKYV